MNKKFYDDLNKEISNKGYYKKVTFAVFVLLMVIILTLKICSP